MIRLLFFVLAFAAVPLNAQTTNTFDVVVVTETLTVVGTTTFQGNAFSVGASTLVVNQGNVGIGTANPSAIFQIAAPAISGTGVQFKWIASSASLRAGEVSGNAWNSTNIGAFSVAFGLDNKALGSYSSVSGGQLNAAEGKFSTVAGGYGNFISTGVAGEGDYSFIGGGQNNVAAGQNSNAFIGGGQSNTASGLFDVIDGGDLNTTQHNNSVVGGGENNTANGNFTVIAGGKSNNLNSCDYCAIGGGGANTNSSTISQGVVIAGGGIDTAGLAWGNSAQGTSPSILGGVKNVATGNYSAVLGGYQNTASGQYSLAAGSGAVASAQGSFVWADSQGGNVTSNTTNEFRARAGGGFALLSSPSSATIIVSSGSILISTSASAATAAPNIFISSTNGNIGIGTTAPSYALHNTGSALTQGQAIIGSTLTVQGNAFSVGGSTLVVSAGSVGISTNSPSGLFMVGSGTMVVTQAGNVGIGTTSPGDIIDVQKNQNATTNFYFRNTDTTNTNSRAFLNFISGNRSLILGAINGDNSYLAYTSGSNMYFQEGYGGSTSIMIKSGGNVGIGTTNPAYALAVNGSLSQTVAQSCSAGVITNSAGEFSGCVASDERLKTKISSMPYDASAIDALNPVYYVWKDTAARDAGAHAGFVAEQVSRVLSQAVIPAGFEQMPSSYTYIATLPAGRKVKMKGPVYNGKALYAVDPNAMIALLVKEVQALRQRVAALEAAQKK